MDSNTPTPAQLKNKVLRHSARTAVAATVSVLVANLFRLPESYWAAIASLLVLQAEFGAVRKVALRRFYGAVLGTSMGALIGTYFGPNIFAFGVALFLLGLLCALMWRIHPRLRDDLDRTAYGYAGITLAVVALVSRDVPPWDIALHRFIESAIGIAVGLVFMTLWPDPDPDSSSHQSQMKVIARARR